jgi:acyl transferase domain-containing protein/enoyl-CoA hydratase/carnithine racemase/acyl carrier protein
MLERLNAYFHGYVATPIIETCRQHGLFKILDTVNFRQREWLIKKLGANKGYFSIALQSLESIGWVERNIDDSYRLTTRENSRFFDANLTSFYNVEPQELLHNVEYSKKICKVINNLLSNIQSNDDLSDCMSQGAILLPLFFAMKEMDIDNFREEFNKLDLALVQTLEKLFIQEGWLTSDKGELTEQGINLFRSRTVAKAVSLRKSLYQMKNLLFGNCAGIFNRHQDVSEAYLEQLFNFDLFGQPQDTYFKDLLNEIIPIFNQYPIEEQPEVIVDVGCVSESMLQQIYQIIVDKTVRGQNLQQYPLNLLGVTNSEQSAVGSTSENPNYQVILGNINQPCQLTKSFESIGLTAEKQILYVCTLLGQKIIVDNQYENNKELSIIDAEQSKYYLDTQGELLSNIEVINFWQQYLRQWSQTIHNYPLLMLEAHPLLPHQAYEQLGQSESFCFDIIQSFSRRCLISAESFITLAASVGLFNRRPAKRYPIEANFCRASLHNLSRRDYVIRHAITEDLNSLFQLEELCWSEEIRASEQDIRDRVQRYPHGQFVLQKNGDVVGVIYSQRIDDIDELDNCDGSNVYKLHHAKGKIIQLLAVNIHPKVQDFSYGDQLLEFMLQRSSLVNGVNQIAAVTRCKEYNKSKILSHEQYIRIEDSSRDPILAFHHTHGAEIVKVLSGYRPKDEPNNGNGVLVTYDIHNRILPGKKTINFDHIDFSNRNNKKVTPQEIRDFVSQKVIHVLGSKRESYHTARPLMEMGLNSVNLLQLQDQLVEEFNLNLSSGFFFEYNTVNMVVDYLINRIGCNFEVDKPKKKQSSEKSNPKVVINKHKSIETDIAIIGMSCKLPGGIETPDQLWTILASGESAISQFPQKRGYWPTNTEKPGIDQGGFILDADAFDAEFFRISPLEAQITDPQQRMLLELSWACLEDAGILPEDLKLTDTGVFIGASNCDYSRLIQAEQLEVQAHNAVGGSLAVLSNRLSYFFDFNGPSILIDTACSSSLVAVHTAIQSLQLGECGTALVGGVNFICHPDLSLAYHKAGMLSPDAKCKVFDAQANGYVRAEGAVMILLKPLSKAINDRDSIQAVIKGSAINHGGLAGGLTVPNPKKQSELIIKAWERANISPQELTYIEAHGTGTSLGDPIEIQGIQKAYSQFENNKGPNQNKIGIGSIKSNIGHLESAAGITGMLKVILSMQHQQIPASINCNNLNPKINLDNTPFFITKKHQHWAGDKSRLAGVSSFGSGGTNAHIILEEFQNYSQFNCDEDNYLFVLSAMNQESLQAYIRKVIDWLENAEINFCDAIYSWQIGRSNMSQRLAIKVTDNIDLLSKLKHWLANSDESSDVWQGNANSPNSTIHSLIKGELGNQIISQALRERDIAQLGVLWVQGVIINWNKLYGKNRPQRISLPTYPFAKERFWIKKAKALKLPVKAKGISSAHTAVLHPLLHRNTSDLNQQSYSSTFSGDEFFLSDHQVNIDEFNESSDSLGEKVLPAVAYLEMVWAAIKLATPNPLKSKALELQNIIWLQPVIVIENKQLSVVLAITDNGQVKFEVNSFIESDTPVVIHCQGVAVFNNKPHSVKLNVEKLREQMSGRKQLPNFLYSMFSKMGFSYGAAHQGLLFVHKGDQQLLAQLCLPDVVVDSEADYILHPSIMDGALQAAICLVTNFNQPSNQPLLPFALEKLIVHSACTRNMFAWVRYSKDICPDANSVKLDIDLCDDQGNICIQLRGYSSRYLRKEINTEIGHQTDDSVNSVSTLIANPTWKVNPLLSDANHVEYSQRHIILCEISEFTSKQLQKIAPQYEYLTLTKSSKNIAERYSEHAVACFELIQTILQKKSKGKVLIQLSVEDSGDHSIFAGLIGLFKTAALENPRITGQIILTPSDLSAELLSKLLKDNLSAPEDSIVKYDQSSRYSLNWNANSFDQETCKNIDIAFKDNGVYLITGGLGALGSLFAKEIFQQTSSARIILTGRSALTEEMKLRLTELSVFANHEICNAIAYQQLNLDNSDQVKLLISKVSKEYNQLNGIIHSAGMISDRLIFTKSSEEFSQVLAPKVTGTYHLDQASKNTNLDFLILFSSIVSPLGNLGQADYATANGFLDQFANYRNSLVSHGQRTGHTLAINWPLWKEGGMGLDKTSLDTLKQTTGTLPMPTELGFSAFRHCLNSGENQVLIMHGLNSKIDKQLSNNKNAIIESSSLENKITSEISGSVQTEISTEIDSDYLLDKITSLLINEAADVIELDPTKIQVDVDFQKYGFDSILLVDFVENLEEKYELELSPTVFFEYSTISRMAKYLAQDFTSVFTQHFTTESKTIGSGYLLDKITSLLINEAADVIELDPSKIQVDVDFQKYGFDSILLVDFVENLEEKYELELSPTVFFEYSTISRMAKYLAQDFASIFIQHLAEDDKIITEKETQDTSQIEVTNTHQEVVSLLPKHSRFITSELPEKREVLQKTDVAIIGMDGIFAESGNINEFWHNIENGNDLMKEIPSDHWDYKPWFDADRESLDKTYCKWGSFVDHVDKFDAEFFDISPREAEWMDPQLRLLIQSIYKTSENAGLVNQIKGSNTAVFVGICFHDYADKIAELKLPTDPHAVTGNYQSVVANRISFEFDLTGPSVAVNTACASSLFALHQACQALHNKECDTAFVGGVNLLLASNHYRHFSSLGALSATGRCHTFDEKADGYVPAEAIASILLKPVQNALEDGDIIHAVVKGSAALHGGSTPSLTAPSVGGEKNVIVSAWKNSDIDPSTLSYIEAHGTGTKLGDPIEISALTQAFQQYTNEKHFCAIGSAKSNIGHAEGAAGIVGIIKVIKQMQNKLIPAMPFFEKINPYIELDKSALYINEKNTLWTKPLNHPRRAGVSSFGFSGSYAHVVLEEYLPPTEITSSSIENENNISVLIPLSARTKEQLQQKASELLDFIVSSEQTNSLVDIAYTLQVGREGMEERLGFIVSSLSQLKEKMSAYIAGDKNNTYYLQGEVKRHKDSLSVFSTDDDMKELISIWIEKKKFPKLLDLWIKGFDLDWGKLYTDSSPRRINLPTYPFAKERHWLDEAHSEKTDRGFFAISSAVSDGYHPLLHKNTSDFCQQSYISTFIGREFFLFDHLVNQQKIFPAVAYLEMARAAIFESVPSQTKSNILELKNIAWTNPIVVNQKKQVSIELLVNDEGQISYEIFSSNVDSQEGQEKLIHCQANAIFSDNDIVLKRDKEQLKGQMGNGVLDKNSLYSGFDSMGLNYGPSHQSLSCVYLGDRELLAELKLPQVIDSTLSDYLLHPSLMDGALQATIALTENFNKLPDKPSIPFALESLRILSACTADMFAWVRYSLGNREGNKLIKLDVDLMDQGGNVCVQMQGFSTRVFDHALSPADISIPVLGSILATPTWQENRFEESNRTEAFKESQLKYQEHHLILCEMSEVEEIYFENLLPQIQCLSLQTTQHKNISERYSEYSLQCFEKLKTIFQSKPQGKVLVQIVIPNTKEQSIFSGLAGLLKTAHIENPLLIGQMILGEAKLTADELSEQLIDNQLASHNSVIKYEGSIRHVLQWQTCQYDLSTTASKKDSFKNSGIYLITGGLGGLGLLFVKEIFQKAPEAKIILTGRSALDEEQWRTKKKVILDGLSVHSEQLDYQQLDICNITQVKQLIHSIIIKHKQLNGIIHSAGMVLDNFILNKTPVEFSRVLEPKVTGTFNLDQASQNIDLDFLMLFSSVTSSLGNSGQADYATANGFMDQFASYRNHLVEKKSRQGLTLSINWPLWKDGGMGIDQSSLEVMQEVTGMHLMQTEAGFQAVYQSFEQEYSQAMPLEGNLAQIQHVLTEPLHKISEQSPNAMLKEEAVFVEQNSSITDTSNLLEKTQDYLRKQLSVVLKLPSHKIDPQASMESYGIDSILSMKLTNQLEKTFGSLSKTLFFEYQSIFELSEYFIKANSAKLKTLFAVVSNQVSLPKTIVRTQERLTSNKRSSIQSVLTNKVVSTEKIAIIGLSGRYPQSFNIEEFWRNLREGNDCIREVPTERWDWQTYYTEDRSKSGQHYSKWGGFIEGVDEFDPLFFNISPREAKYIDPQERLFLQHAWMAVEDAGYTRSSLQKSYEQDDLPGQVGVYVGVMFSEYQLLSSEVDASDQRMGFAGNLASIANRVSYVLNLHGPSMIMDTMCSSSLTSIHTACQDLKHGHTNLAIAGGVNVSVHPRKYLMLSVGQFISSEGQCQSFGEGGDGYIPGEGVGAVILKRLSEAEADGDHIYGIIKGSSLSHGGKTNGYTVPNPQAQAEAISRALAESGTNPRHVSYIEAHGTGTKLGDPIEIAALCKAFNLDAQDNSSVGFCSIGSAKSNIGHCESAAGIAGLTKVLLQMKHQKIVPSLHSSKLNPNIDFAKTPFVVNQTLKKWEQPLVDGQLKPRIAGISSFGAGGSNAHIVVEEYSLIEKDDRTDNVENNAPVIILLSARTSEQLHKKSLDLLDAIYTLETSENYELENGSAPLVKAIDLESMAYTLQLGREAMEERLAIIVSSTELLVEKLKAYINSEQNIEDTYIGQVKRYKESMLTISQDEDMKVAIDKWIEHKKFAKLADLWSKGLNIGWEKLYLDVQPNRMSLPSYPFAKEKYWLDILSSNHIPIAGVSNSRIHPLLHTNTSVFGQQRYSSSFNGQEFFIKENEVSGEKTLSISVLLEMARAAIEQASPDKTVAEVQELHDIVWIDPIVVTEDRLFNIALIERDIYKADFEIYSQHEEHEIICCQGQTFFNTQYSPTAINLDQVKKDMTCPSRETNTCNEELINLHQGDDQLLVELCLPFEVQNTRSKYGLYPDVIDRALYEFAKILFGSNILTATPSAIKSIHLVSDFKKDIFVWLRKSSDILAENNLLILDIDFCDRLGNIYLQMKGVEYIQHSEDLLDKPFYDEDFLSLPQRPKELTLIPAELDKPMAKKLILFNDVNLKFTSINVNKPNAITLKVLDDLASEEIDFVSNKVENLKLHSIIKQESIMPSVRLYDQGSGVFSIQIKSVNVKNKLSEDISQQLMQAINTVTQESLVKVLIIEGTESYFLSGDREDYNHALEQNLFNTIVTFPYPIIAAMQGEAHGAGFLVGALCDFMICSQQGSYCYSNKQEKLYPAAQEYSFFKERFGEIQAQDFLYLSTPSTGKQLKDKGWNCTIVSQVDVQTAVQKLADNLASKPQNSLRILKHHLTQQLVKTVYDLNVVSSYSAMDGRDYHSGEITSPVEFIKVSIHSESILLVKIGIAKKVQHKKLLTELANILLQIKKNSKYKSVVIESDYPEFIPKFALVHSESGMLDFQRILLELHIPVITVLHSGAKDFSWYISLFCDVCIYSENGRYSFKLDKQNLMLAKDTAVIFLHRFGSYLGREILLTGKEYTGAELQQKLGFVKSAEQGQILDTALEIAKTFANQTVNELAAWKSETSLNILQKIKQQLTWSKIYDDKLELQSVHKSNVPVNIPLNSTVIKATLHSESVLVVTMEARKEKNMFSEAFIEGMYEVFNHIEHTPAYKVVVLTGYDNYFASGGTKETLLAIHEGKAKFTDKKVFQLAKECKLPVISAMQGHGIGAGWSLGMYSDLIFFSEESQYVSPYMNYGFTPGAGSTFIFPDKMGIELAKETLFSAQYYTGSDLKSRGMLTPALPRKQVYPAVLELAKQIAQSSRSALIALKQQFNCMLDGELEKTYLLELAMHEKTFVGQSITLEKIQTKFSLDREFTQEETITKVTTVNYPESNLTLDEYFSVDKEDLSSVISCIKKLLAQELLMQEKDIEDDSQFVDLGLDSITGVTWVRQINAIYKISMGATQVYSYPTIFLLGQHVEQEVNKLNPRGNSFQPISLSDKETVESAAIISSEKSFSNAEALFPIIMKLKKLLAQELDMQEQEVDEDIQFVDLGLDSITGVIWVRKINEAYKVSIEATKVYHYSTITLLSRHVKEEMERSGTLTEESASSSVELNIPKVTPVLKKNVAKLVTKKLTSLRTGFVRRTVRESFPNHQLAPIAVIGMAGQFPQANNLDEFWENIAEGKNCISRIPESRWSIEQYYQKSDTPIVGKTNSQWMGAIEEFDLFDPLFFNISPIEAESMDPQQRLFLQACWSSIENAGYNAQSLSGSLCGVFVGCANGDYHQLSQGHKMTAQGFTGEASSILGARISYFLNLRGPCLSIDTACSSSLVAIASACDSLNSCASDIALAGGVSMMSSPEMHIKTSQAGMLSSDGQCYTFDQRANGFVPGEAVGVVVLKRLKDALEDRDLVVGTIEGWGVNQDGKTNGITAPNPEAQTRLQQYVYDKYQIDPADIQLVEAHGTGTKLGDPIEVRGLQDSFTKYTQKTDYCALGSVKSNIGHCLTAAGISGFIKLILALKNKQLPPTINFTQLNEHIGSKDNGLKGSPFYINDRLRKWELNGSDKRQAAISSFGFGGTNAHIVVGEYQASWENKEAVYTSLKKAKIIVPVSAKTKQQLKQKAKDLYDFIISSKNTAHLIDIAYTLQIGREPMEERLGFLVHSAEQLAQKLKAYINGEDNIQDVYQDQVNRNKESMTIVSHDDDMKNTIIDKWISRNKYSKLVELWVKGLAMDWDKLYGEDKPARVNLPTYPFAKERYWFEPSQETDLLPVTTSQGLQSEVTVKQLHPLLHCNTSDLVQQRYTSTFNGQEFYLKDHQVRFDRRTEQKVLPAVAYLEMARAALTLADPEQAKCNALELHNTVWAQPIVVSEQKEISVALLENEAGANQQIGYVIYSSNSEQEIIHGQGLAIYTRRPEPSKLDIEQLKRLMTKDKLASASVYSFFLKMGLSYGPSHQGISEILIGDGQLLAQLNLPSIIEKSQNNYVLHPSLMDSALQSSVALIADLTQIPNNPSLPFALDRILIISACTSNMFAWVRYSTGYKFEDKLIKLDIDLCDQEGNICIQMRGFSTRAVEQQIINQNMETDKDDEISDSEQDRNIFDDDFYQKIISSVLDNKISVDDAVKLG